MLWKHQLNVCWQSRKRQENKKFVRVIRELKQRKEQNTRWNSETQLSEEFKRQRSWFIEERKRTPYVRIAWTKELNWRVYKIRIKPKRCNLSSWKGANLVKTTYRRINMS